MTYSFLFHIHDQCPSRKLPNAKKLNVLVPAQTLRSPVLGAIHLGISGRWDESFNVVCKKRLEHKLGDSVGKKIHCQTCLVSQNEEYPKVLQHCALRHRFQMQHPAYC
jgi:hypothetical protein